MVNNLYSYKDTKELVDNKGWDALLKNLNEDYKNYDLYTVSTAWYDDPKYIMKAKGANGDVIIGWLEDELEERRL